MPTYDYECSECECLLEDITQGMTEKPLTLCPTCGEHALLRVISGGLPFQMKKMETIGQLANKNAKTNKTKIQEAAAKKREDTPEEPKTWVEKLGGDATSQEINKMSPKQKTKYVMEGKK
jgi:putative FmdB family regulatory protein